MANPASGASAAFDVSQRYVRILGEKHGLIEFEFAIGDPETAIELLMPPQAFHSFCSQQNARVLDTGPRPAELRLDLPTESANDRKR